MEQNKSKTWRALVGSMISLFLCVALLAGTTFAWFADSVTSETVKIISGNLDVALSVRNEEGQYVTVDENTALFDSNAFWEPGCTRVVYLKIENLGKLALKYRFCVNVLTETPGTNTAGNPILLSDYLKFGVIRGDTETVFDTREDAQAAIGEGQRLTGTFSMEGRLLSTGSADYLALIVYMPGTVGSEINYKTGVTPPSIQLETTLVAAQESGEPDSFDENYDAGAVLPVMSAAELQNRLNEGGGITLGRDIPVIADGTGAEDEHQVMPQLQITGKTAYLDLSGRTLSFDISEIDPRVAYLPALLAVGSGAKLTVGGSGTVTGHAGSEYRGSIGLYVDGGTLIINSGTYYGYPHAVEAAAGTLKITGGFFDIAPELKNADPANAILAYGLLVVAEGASAEITGGTFVNYNPCNYVPSGYIVVQEAHTYSHPTAGETQEYWYTVVPSAN